MSKESTIAASPETQELIDLCLALEDNPDRLAELQDKADLRLEEMHHAEDSFFAGVEAQGDEFYQEFRHHLERIEAEYSAYGDTLEDILEGTFNAKEAALQLAEASRGLRVSMASYEEAYLSRGDSPYGVVNLLRNLAERSGKRLWTDTCERYQTYYQEALKEIEASGTVETPGVKERKAALEGILDCLTELSVLPTSQDSLEPLLSRLAEEHAKLDHAFDTYHRHEFAEGPTRAPKLNWLIKATEGVLAGTYKPRVLEGLAQELLDLTQHNLAELKAMARNKLDSAVLTEELARMTRAMEELEEDLDFLLDYSQGQVSDPQRVREALQDLMDSGDELAESVKLVREVQENTGKVTCVQCQTTQEKGARVCVQCGAMLPQLPEEGVYTHGSSSFQVLEGDPADLDRDEIMTDVMHALFESCEAFMNGKLPGQELIQRVDAGLSEVSQAETRLNRLKTPELPSEVPGDEKPLAHNFIDLAEDALILLSMGVEECKKGLFSIRESAERDDLEALRAGMRTYYEGTQKMWQVRRLERQFTQYLEGAN